MSKKSKKESIPELVNSSKTTKVKDTTQYISGNVNIKLQQGRTTIKKVNIHNTATLDLLYGMLLSLSNKIDTNKLPRFLGVGTGTIQGENPEQIVANMTSLVDEVTITRTLLTSNYKGPPTKDTVNCVVSVVYQGIIPFSDLGVSKNIKEIGLFGTQNGNSLLARVQLDDTPISISQGQSLIIEWTFKIQNYLGD